MEAENQVQKPVIIEQTSKKYKRQIVLSVLLIVVGIFVSVSSQGGSVGGLMIFGGIVWFIVTKFIAWWNHA